MEFSSELLGVFIILLTIYLNYYFKRYKLNKFFDQFPSPPAVPIFGNALDFRSTTAYLKTLKNYTKNHGKVVAVKLGLFRRFLIITDYKWVEFVLGSQKVMTKAVNYRYFVPWLGDGILTSTGLQWKTHRKIVTPAFHFKILEDFVEIFEKASDTLVKKLREKGVCKSIDVDPLVSLCTLDVICESAMGVSVNAQENEDSQYVRSVKEMCNIIISRSISPIKGNDFLYLFTEDYRKEKKHIKILHDFVDKVIKIKFEKLEKKTVEQNGNIEEDIGQKKKKAFLDLLLEARVNGQPITLKDIRDEVNSFMFGGHDTGAAVTNFTLYSLAKYPEIQAKVLEEQQHLFGDNQNPNVTYEDLQEMKYLETVIKETMRIFAPAQVLGRRTEEDVEFDGQIIPKGVNFLIFVQGIHSNPEFYPEPEKFDPSRFENMDKRLPYSYIPFSAGPRNCLGQKYAMLELKSIISKIVRNFELKAAIPDYELVLASEVIVKSKTGVNIGLKPRGVAQNGAAPNGDIKNNLLVR